MQSPPLRCGWAGKMHTCKCTPVKCPLVHHTVVLTCLTHARKMYACKTYLTRVRSIHYLSTFYGPISYMRPPHRRASYRRGLRGRTELHHTSVRLPGVHLHGLISYKRAAYRRPYASLIAKIDCGCN